MGDPSISVRPREIIRDAEALSAFLASVAEAPFLAIDTETNGLDPLKDHVLLIQVGTGERQAVIDAQALAPEALAPLFAPERLVVLHHAKFDLKMLAAHGVPRPVLAHARVMDTMLAEQLIRNGRRTELANGRMGLDALAERYAGMSLDKSVRAGFFGAAGAEDVGDAEVRYAERDVEATWKVFAAQLPILESEGLIKTAAIEGAACFAYASMELAGFPIDCARWRELLAAQNEALAATREVLKREFEPVAERDLFGVRHINFDDDSEVLAALAKLGATVNSVRREVLLSTGHPAARALAEHREHQKIASTYGESFLQHVHPKSGRFHPDFKAIGATTGRSACSDPNLQNIPRGSHFRACFRAPPGRKMITADYSGAELRILAQASKDPVFVRTFGEGGDLHSIVATQIFGVRVSKHENAQLRERAKQINFGLAYGMGAGGLAHQLGTSIDEAQRLLDRYFSALPAVRRYLDASAQLALGRGWAETLAGRRFWLVDMNRKREDDGSKRRVAMNMPIQGTNADMIKLAMGRICRVFAERRLDAELVNMIHDELVVEANEAVAEAVRGVVVSEMVAAGAEFIRAVPVEVEAKIDDAWAK